MKKDCEAVRKNFSAYLDDELTKQEKSAIQSHEKNCESCRRELAELETMVKAVRSLPEMAAPENLHQKITGRLIQADAGQHRSKITLLLPKIISVAACLLLILSTLLFLRLRHAQEIAEKRMAQLEQLEKAVDAASEVASARRREDVADSRMARQIERPADSLDMTGEAASAPRDLAEMPTRRAEEPAVELEKQKSVPEPEIADDTADMDMSGDLIRDFQESIEGPVRKRMLTQNVHIDTPPVLDTLSRLLEIIKPAEPKNISVTFDIQKPQMEMQIELDAENFYTIASLLQKEYGASIQMEPYSMADAVVGGIRSRRMEAGERLEAEKTQYVNIYIVESDRND